MSFAAPGILLGLLLLSLPLWLHRLRTDSARSEPFSSVRLLEAASQRVFVDRKIRYWLLLALRLALLALAVLIFARPQLNFSVADEQDQTFHWLLVDLSASMQRPALLDGLPARVQSVLDGIPAGQPVGLLAARSSIEVVLPLGQSRSALVNAADGLTPGNSRLDFGILVGSVGDFLDRSAANAVVHLLSDYQASALPAQFSQLVPRAPYQLQLHPIAGTTQNLWIAAAGIEGDTLIARLGGNAGAAEVRVQVGDDPPIAVTTDAASNQVRAPLNLLPQQNLVHITVQDAAIRSDNHYHLLLDRSPREQVPLLSAGLASGDEQANPYLSAALTAVSTRAEFAPVAVADFDPRRLSRHRWLVIEDLGSLPASLLQPLEAWVRSGGRVLAGAGAAAQGLRRLPLTGHELLTPDLSPEVIDEPQAAAFVTGVAAGHPLLDQRLSFRDIQVSQLLPLSEMAGDLPLLWLDDGQPLVLEHVLGDGRVLLLNGGFDRRYNDWPTRASFVPFVGVVADYLAGHRTLQRQRLAGEVLTLPQLEDVSYEVVAPDAAGELFGQTLGRAGARLDQIGFYAVHGSDGSIRNIAVNVDPRESVLTPLDEATLTRWRDALTQRNARGAEPADAAPANPADHRLVIWLLCGLLALVLGESLLGNYSMRKPA